MTRRWAGTAGEPAGAEWPKGHHGTVRGALVHVLDHGLGHVDVDKGVTSGCLFSCGPQCVEWERVRGVRAVAQLDAVGGTEPQAIGVDPFADGVQGVEPAGIRPIEVDRRDQYAATDIECRSHDLLAVKVHPGRLIGTWGDRGGDARCARG